MSLLRQPLIALNTQAFVQNSIRVSSSNRVVNLSLLPLAKQSFLQVVFIYFCFLAVGEIKTSHTITFLMCLLLFNIA